MKIIISNIQFENFNNKSSIIKVPTDLTKVKQWMQDGKDDEYIDLHPISDVEAAALYIRTWLFQQNFIYDVKHIQWHEVKEFTADVLVHQPYDANVSDDTYDSFSDYEVCLHYAETFNYIVTYDDVQYHDIDDQKELIGQVAYQTLLDFLPITISMMKR